MELNAIHRLWKLKGDLWRRLWRPAESRIKAPPPAADYSAWARRLTEALTAPGPATPVMQPPHLAAPLGAELIDLTGVKAVTWDSKLYYFDNALGANISYTCPEDCLAVIRYWGFTCTYDASAWDVNGPWRYLIFSLLNQAAPAEETAIASITGTIRPAYTRQYRPGPAESICLNALHIMRPGDTVMPAMCGSSGQSGTVAVLARVWGWQFLCPGAGQL